MYNYIYIIGNAESHNKYIQYGFYKFFKKQNINTMMVKKGEQLIDGNNLYIIIDDIETIHMNNSSRYIFINDYSTKLYDSIIDNKIRIKEITSNTDISNMEKIKENIFKDTNDSNTYYSIFGSIMSPMEMLYGIKDDDKNKKEIFLLKNDLDKPTKIFNDCDVFISSIENIKKVKYEYKSILLFTDNIYDIKMMTFYSLGLNIYTNETKDKKEYYGKTLCYYKQKKNEKDHMKKIIRYNKSTKKTVEKYEIYEKIINYYNFTYLINFINKQ